MASEATCPFCGAERCGEFEWSCGTELRFGEKHGQSENCELRQQNADLRWRLSASDKVSESRVAFVPTVKIASETCPHCGAERSGLTSDGRFACGTLGGSRSPFCYSRQLATVTAERDELRRRLAEFDKSPVGWVCVYPDGRLDAFDFYRTRWSSKADGHKQQISPKQWGSEYRPGCEMAKYRLVRDEQPQQETVK